MDAPGSRPDDLSGPSPPESPPEPALSANNDHATASAAPPAPEGLARAAPSSRRKKTQISMPELSAPALAADMPGMPLEERVRRLEDALAQLQHLQSRPTPATAQIQRQPDPPSSAAPSATDLLLDVGKRLLSHPETTPPPAPAPPPPAPPPRASMQSHLWLLADTFAEARAIFRMFVDPRYQLPWSARIVPLVLILAILSSYYWVPFSSVVVLGYWTNKAVDLLLAFLLFKVLGHEARRYRQTSPDLPSNLRL